MVTKKDLLLEGIKVPDEQEKVEMALPPSLNGKESDKTKKNKGLFSPALFRESRRSNRLGLTIVSIGNALIMIIIVMILSTLNINSTADALKDLFNNADTETTIKSGSISLYSAFDNTATAYLTYDNTQKELVSVNQKALSEVDDSTLNTQINVAKAVYDGAYRLAGQSTSDEATRNSTAKNATMTAVETTLNNNSSLSEQEKYVGKQILSHYFDIYATDKNAETKTILTKAVPMAFTDALTQERNLNADQSKAVQTIYDNLFTRVVTNSEDSTKCSTEAAFDLVSALADGDQQEFAQSTTKTLKDKYLENPDAYLTDPTIQSNLLSTACQDYVFKILNEFAYYQYLPDFRVDYVTSDRGYPVRYVGTGTYADNGNEILKQIEVKSYNPDVYVLVKGDMGTTSNMLEKMHKEVITGEPYTEKEIADAKEEADKNMGTVKDELASFMSEFLLRDSNNKNDYFDGTNLQEENIASRSVKIVSDVAEKELIDRYNEDHKVKIQSIEEITADNYSMDGSQMMSLVKGYASSGIASYKTHLQNAQEKGYDTMDCMLVATVKGSQGVVGQLPTKVDDSLEEMGGMNTYGIMVGVVAFGIAALLIPMVYTILLSTNLVSDKVQSGSLAFTLSTPTTRGSFVFTQGVYLIFSEIVMGASILLATILAQSIGVAAGGTDLLTSLPISDICYYALGNFMVTLAVSGICFLASCYFNKTIRAIGSGGGLTIFFFICSILGLFGTKAIPGTIRIKGMSYFNYVTIDSLFDGMAVMTGDFKTYWFKLMWLLVIVVITYALGDLIFTKKDLPL